MKKLLSIFALLLSIVSFVSPAASETKIALSKITSIDISKDIAYIATLDGRIYYDGKTLDISDRIKFAGNWGLMTVRANPSGTYLYVYYTAKTTVTSASVAKIVVSRFPITLAGLGPEQVVFDQVYSPSAIHAGGGLAFETDAVLLVSTGDGAFPNQDVWSPRAQSIDSYNGKVLRMDAATGEPMPDNQFTLLGSASAPYVQAIGLRSPFRMNRLSDGKVYIADVGNIGYEEINVYTAGANFGWPYREGPDTGILTTTQPMSYTEPLVSYVRGAEAAAITGVALWNGQIWYSDFSRKKVFNSATGEFIPLNTRPTDMLVDKQGCLVAVGFNESIVGDAVKICARNAAPISVLSEYLGEVISTPTATPSPSITPTQTTTPTPPATASPSPTPTEVPTEVATATITPTPPRESRLFYPIVHK